MNLSRKNGLLLAGLLAIGGVSLYEIDVIREERNQAVVLTGRMASRDRDFAALKQRNAATQRDLAEAERQLAALGATARDGLATDAAQAREMQAWLDRAKRLKAFFAERPDQSIPEMRWLDEADWLRAAQRSLETEAHVRWMMAEVREAARRKFRPQIIAAMKKYEAAGEPRPSDIMALLPYFDPPADPGMLQQYEIVNDINRSATPGRPLAVSTRVPVDEIYDYRASFTAGGGSVISSGFSAWIPDYNARYRRAEAAYKRATPNPPAKSPHVEVLRFFDPPLPREVLEREQLFERER